MHANRLFLLTFILLTACQGQEPMVREAAQKYLDARLNYDFSRAMLYTTPDSYERVEELASLSEDLLDSNKDGMQFRITDITLEGDSALVGYELENYFGQEHLKLYKIEQSWYVKLDFDDVPDPAMLAQDLSLMESEDTITKMQRDLDKMLLEEEDSLSNHELDLD